MNFLELRAFSKVELDWAKLIELGLPEGEGRGQLVTPALLSVAASAPAAIPYALKNGMLVRPTTP